MNTYVPTVKIVPEPEAIKIMRQAVTDGAKLKYGQLLVIVDKCAGEYVDCAVCPCPKRCRDLYAHLLPKLTISNRGGRNKYEHRHYE